MPSLSFELLATDGSARRGRLTTAHGVIETPVFMPVGTAATVKGLTPEQLRQVDARIILGNTYHLALRPGAERIAELGGLHQFMAWPGSILTDSGGYQVFSLAEQREISDAGVAFRSHIDGAALKLTPEDAIHIQALLGSDIAMCLDECPSSVADDEVVRLAMERTIRWAERCKVAHRRPDQALFGIVQGGLHIGWRIACAERLTTMGFPGYALGGFSVGEPGPRMLEILTESAPALPAEKPRYLMGVGRPQDLIEAVARGIDMFDCVLPTRNGRNAQAFTRDGPLRLRNAQHRGDPRPVEEGCRCYCCKTFSRAYLHHLFQADEMLGPVLLSLHNVAYFLNLMSQMREAIEQRRFEEFRVSTLARLNAT